MRKKILFVSSLMLLSSLSGCKNTAPVSSSSSASGVSSSSSSTTSTSSLPSSEDVNDIATFLGYLSKEGSVYQTEVKEGTKSLAKSVYRPDYFGWSEDKETNGYFLSKEGVASFSLEKNDEGDREFVSGFLLKDEKGKAYSSIYAASLSSFYGFSSSVKGATASFTDKKEVLFLLSMAGFGGGDYLKLSGYKADVSYKSVGGIKSLLISFLIQDVSYTLTVDHLETASIDSADLYLKENGEAFVPDADESRIFALFALNEFSHSIYNEDQLLSTEYFNPQYYYMYYSDLALQAQPLLASYMKGYVKLDSKGEGLSLYTSKALIYDDIYLFQISKEGAVSLITRENPNRIGYAQGGFTSVQEDVVSVMNYPSNLLLLKELQFLKKKSEGKYEITNQKLIQDFIKNFNIYGAAVSNTVSVESSLLTVTFTEGDRDSTCKVGFHLKVDGATGVESTTTIEDQMIDFTGFGRTTYQPVENFLTKNNLKID
jgi:hypothetical protein